jgi:hypothetical protein
MLYNNLWLHEELVNLANSILELDEATAIETVLDLAYSLEALSETPQEDVSPEEVPVTEDTIMI